MEQPVPPSMPSETEMPPAPQSSLFSRLANVIASPGEVFSEIRLVPVSAANWLAPACLLLLVGWIGTYLVMSRPNIQHQLKEISSEAIEKQIKSRNVPAEQAEQMRAAGEKFGAIGTQVGAYATPAVIAFGTPFIWGFFVWLGAMLLLKSPIGYMKAVEVVGMANMILVLDGVVRTLLILISGNIFASPSLALLVKNFDPQNMSHNLLALVNIMVFWLLLVRSIGLARVAGAGLVKAAIWVFGVWIAYTGFFMALGKGIQLLFGGKS